MGVARQEIEALFLEHGPGVGRYFRARLNDPDLAEELTARVFLKVVHKYHQLKGSAAAWLWTIVRTELSKYFRDRKKNVHPDETLVSDERSPSEHLLQLEMQGRLQQALVKLPEEQQTIIYFKFFQQMSNGEIAKAIGLSASNIGTIVHRSLQVLRELMEPEEANDSESQVEQLENSANHSHEEDH